jgi:transposase-like protein
VLTPDLHSELDERAIGQIADRVIAALREDLRAIAAHLLDESVSADQLTVDQVARRLGVARSTVYAHWRQWGGYKLGPGDKAPIRFDASRLAPGAPTTGRLQTTGTPSARRRTRKPRIRRDLVEPTPRLGAPFSR